MSIFGARGMCAGVMVAAVAASTASAAPVHRRCRTEEIARLSSAAALPQFPAVAHLVIAETRTVFLNRNGGTFTFEEGASTDSATNLVSASVIGDGMGRTSVIPPFPSDLDWPALVSCVAKYYQPFNIVVTEIEPSSGAYVEAVIGGDSSLLSFPPDSLFGIAAADNFCGVSERGVAFVFPGIHLLFDEAERELCTTVAHEVGHILSLEHSTLGIDIMSYVTVAEVPSKSFVDQTNPCGVYPGVYRMCFCDEGGTNTKQRLTQSLGARPAPTPPTVSIDTPFDRDRVSSGFMVELTASDNQGLAKLEILIDSRVVATLSEPPFVYTTEPSLRMGIHTVSARAHDVFDAWTVAPLISVVRSDEVEPEPPGDDGGCHTTHGAPVGWAVWILLVVVVTRGRQRLRS